MHVYRHAATRHSSLPLLHATFPPPPGNLRVNSIHAASFDREHGTRFAVIYAYRTKDYGNFEFISDPQHDFNDDRVALSTYSFGDAGREVRIVKDNLDIITECARHAHDAATKVGAGGGD